MQNTIGLIAKIKHRKTVSIILWNVFFDCRFNDVWRMGFHWTFSVCHISQFVHLEIKKRKRKCWMKCSLFFSRETSPNTKCPIILAKLYLQSLKGNQSLFHVNVNLWFICQINLKVVHKSTQDIDKNITYPSSVVYSKLKDVQWSALRSHVPHYPVRVHAVQRMLLLLELHIYIEAWTDFRQ